MQWWVNDTKAYAKEMTEIETDAEAGVGFEDEDDDDEEDKL